MAYGVRVRQRVFHALTFDQRRTYPPEKWRITGTMVQARRIPETAYSIGTFFGRRFGSWTRRRRQHTRLSLGLRIQRERDGYLLHGISDLLRLWKS